MPINLPVQSLQQLPSNNAPQGDVRAELAAGRTLEASVREVTPDPQRPNLFRIKVEVQRQLMELITSQPLNTGARINLSQDAAGKLQLALLNAQSQSPQNAVAQAKIASQPPLLQLRIPSQDQGNTSLSRLLPTGEAQIARVITNTPAPQPSQAGTQPQAPQQTSQPAPQPAAQPASLPSYQTTTGSGASSAPAASVANQNQAGGPQASQPQAENPAAQGTTSRAPQPGTAPSSGQAQTNTSTPAAVADEPANRPTQPLPSQPAPSKAAPSNPTPSNPALSGNDTGRPQPSYGEQAATRQPAPPPAPAATTTATTAREQTSLPRGTAAPPSNPQSSATAAGERTNSAQQPATAARASLNTSSPAPQPAKDGAAPEPATPNNTAAIRASAAQGSPAQPLPQPSPQPSFQPHTGGITQVTLAVNGQQIELLSPRPLQPGLEVQLTRTANNQVQLQIAPPRNDNGAQLKLQEGLQQILRDNLPQQLPAGDALNQMRQLSATSRGGTDAVAQVVKSLLSLFSVAPKSDAKTTQQVVQNHLQSSGLIGLTKTNTSGGKPELPPLQQQLGKLNQLAEQLPPQAREQMLTLVKGLQARSASHQATSLQNWQELPDGSLERQYRLDLPIRLDRDRLEDSEIRIQQQKRPDEQGRFVSQWSIQLHFDREELGSVDAHVSLQQEWQLSARFWAERDDTAHLIREQLDSFQQQLGASGFQVEALQVQRGRPPRDTRSPINHRLVDLHT